VWSWWGGTSWIQFTHSLKPPGFNPPCACEAKILFQSLLSDSSTCTATSWDVANWNRIEHKRSIADTAVVGTHTFNEVDS
jgi:hypothetical protein